MKKLSLAALVLGLSVFLAGCIPGAKQETTPTDTAAGTMEAKKVAGDSPEGQAVNAENLPVDPEAEKMAADGGDLAQVADARKITIDGFKFGYSEERIEVKAGETVQLTLTNSDGMHDFNIDELGVKTKVIQKGETDTVTFTVPMDAKGKTFEYYCSVMNHRQMGQVGKLIVK
jgi:plastocyanin